MYVVSIACLNCPPLDYDARDDGDELNEDDDGLDTLDEVSDCILKWIGL